MAWKAALGAYPGWGGGAWGMGISVFPVAANCDRLTAKICNNWKMRRVEGLEIRSDPQREKSNAEEKVKCHTSLKKNLNAFAISQTYQHQQIGHLTYLNWLSSPLN